MNSPYLEETYYYRITPRWFALHRNYRCDTDFDEHLLSAMAIWCWSRQAFTPSLLRPARTFTF